MQFWIQASSLLVLMNHVDLNRHNLAHWKVAVHFQLRDPRVNHLPDGDD